MDELDDDSTPTSLWSVGDTVTDLDTGTQGTITDIGDGRDIDTMTFDWESENDEND
jgi:hypothetical protein